MIIIDHMKSDPNAVKHADAGMIAFFVSVLAFVTLGMPFVFVFIAPFIMGVVIEIVQRFQRAFKDWKFVGFTHSGQNTIKESVLDVMQTGFFYVTYYANRAKENE